MMAALLAVACRTRTCPGPPLISGLGIPQVDSADPTELAAVCRETGRGSFMLVAGRRCQDLAPVVG
jgi:hypothetical protein